MSKLKIFSVLVLSFIFPTLIFAADMPVTATEVIVYQPALPSGKPVMGNCWTTSVAAQRPGAWRCMVGNAIHDPCFTTSDANKLVCNADPVKQQTGFVLQLTKPLPTKTFIANQTNGAWLLQLADGSVCRPYTGTLSMINNTPVRYYCSDSQMCKFHKACVHLTGLLDFPAPGKVWSVQKATYSTSIQGTVTSQSIKQVNVSKVWQ